MERRILENQRLIMLALAELMRGNRSGLIEQELRDGEELTAELLQAWAPGEPK